MERELITAFVWDNCSLYDAKVAHAKKTLNEEAYRVLNGKPYNVVEHDVSLFNAEENLYRVRMVISE